MEFPTVVVHPTAEHEDRALADPDIEWKWAVDSIRTAGEYAAEQGVSFSLECWNRFESYFFNRLEQARTLGRHGADERGVQGDTFHMNIEEASIADAFRASAGVLQHVHLADSDRTAPGGALIDFEPIIDALVEIGYDKYLSFELLPAAANPFSGGRHEEFDRYTERAIRTIKAVEELVRTRRTLGREKERECQDDGSSHAARLEHIRPRFPFSDHDVRLFAKVRGWGYDHVEVCIEDPTRLTAATVASAANDEGLSVLVCGAFGPDRDISNEDPAERQGGVDYLRH